MNYFRHLIFTSSLCIGMAAFLGFSEAAKAVTYVVEVKQTNIESKAHKVVCKDETECHLQLNLLSSTSRSVPVSVGILIKQEGVAFLKFKENRDDLYIGSESYLSLPLDPHHFAQQEVILDKAPAPDNGSSYISSAVERTTNMRLGKVQISISPLQ